MDLGNIDFHLDNRATRASCCHLQEPGKQPCLNFHNLQDLAMYAKRCMDARTWQKVVSESSQLKCKI